MVIQSHAEPEQHLGTIVIDRPDVKNALSSEVYSSLSNALENFISNDRIRVIILTAVGDTFSAGADIDEFQEKMDDPDGIINYMQTGQKVFTQIEESPVPVIAKLNGPAQGAGVELAMACDLRVATSKTEFRLSEITMAVIPPFERLKQYLSEGLVQELCFTARPLTAEEGSQYDIFNRVVSDDKLDTATRELAEQIVSNSPYALAKTKEALIQSDGLSTKDSISHRYALTYQCFNHPDFQESINAFKEKRSPDYS